MLFVAVFELVAGVAIIGLWAILLTTHQVPEIQARDRSIWFHLAAEFALGAVLIASGLLLLSDDAAWMKVLAGTAAGGMVYSTINSPGYYARQGKWGAVAGFSVLTLLGMVTVVLLLVI